MLALISCKNVYCIAFIQTAVECVALANWTRFSDPLNQPPSSCWFYENTKSHVISIGKYSSWRNFWWVERFAISIAPWNAQRTLLSASDLAPISSFYISGIWVRNRMPVDRRSRTDEDFKTCFKNFSKILLYNFCNNSLIIR